MAGTGRSLASTGGILALLLASGCSVGSAASQAPGYGASDVVMIAVGAGPTLVDNAGVPLSAEHAEAVRSVYQGLAAGDLGVLRELYAGNDWAGQQELLAQPRVRDEVLAVLRTHPANLGEGYVYPAEATAGYDGYQTAFFLAPQDGGPLQWYGIDRLAGVTAAD